MTHSFISNINIPNYPPPVPSMQSQCSLQPTASSSSSNLEITFINLLKEFNNNRLTKQNFNDHQVDNKNSKTLRLSEIKNDMQNTLKTMEYLRNKETELYANLTKLNNNDWNHEWHNIQIKLSEISRILLKLQNNNKLTSTTINKTILNRRKKRSKQKLHKKELQALKAEKLLNRKKLHAKIDEWQNEQALKDLKEKQKKSNVERAEQILGGANKKKAESLKYIALFDGLKELRRVRRIQANKSDTGEQYFNEQMDKLINIWQDQLKNYEIEENELRVHLLHTNKSVADQWLDILFGDDCNNNDNLNYLKNFLLRSNYDFNEFVRVRRAWDLFIVRSNNTLGTSIPLGWVMPNPNPSDKWSIYRVT